jgi:parallel beta-helix repeat protein
MSVIKYGKGKKIGWLFLMLALILICVGIPGVSAAVIDVPGDYTMIQYAIDNASAGDVINVSAGTYEEYITVGKTLTLQGVGNPVIQGDLTTNLDLVTLTANGIVFEGFVVADSDRNYKGIGISGNDVVVQDCVVTNNGFGLFLDTVTNATIERTTISESASNNIYMTSSTLCTIRQNTIISGAQNTGYSIEIRSGSSQNTIADNEIRDSLEATGMWIYSSSNNVVTGNTISNCSVEYGYGGIMIQSSDNTVCSENVIENSGNEDGAANAGIYLTDSDNAIISSNTINGSGQNGLLIEDSKNATLTGNTLANNHFNFGLTGTYNYHSHYDTHTIDSTNTVDGRPLVYRVGETGTTIGAASNAGTVYCVNCDDVTVEDLVLSNTYNGVVLWGTTHATVSNVSVETCEHGIDLLSSDNATISDVSVTDCYRGFNIRYATDNTITQSTVSDPSYYGVDQRDQSSGNTIYLNSFSGSSYDVYSLSSDTLWNSPTTLVYYYNGTEQAPQYLGNHWADYAGTDGYGDGIGDTAFAISNDNDDANPLIAPHTAYTFAANQPPSASFTWSPLLPNSTQSTQFTDTSVDPDGTIAAWEWDFGDTGTSTAEDPIHIYAAPGWYIVTLNVTDDLGETGSASNSLYVHEPGPMTIWVPDNATTIQGGVDMARDGDTVMVRSGTYDENITVTKQVTMTGIGWPVINGSGKDNDTVRLQTDNIVFEGFEVRNAEDAGIYVRLNNNNVVRNNRVLESGYCGIYVRGSDGAIIHNNTCDDNGDSGIYLLDASNCVVYYNDLNNYNEGTGEFYNAAESGTIPSTNRWYNESLMRGNRYSDYEGSDANGDGIGDTPYNISVAEGPQINSDPYPLMPTGSAPIFPPTITSITESAITADSATVRWTIGNDVESNSRVLYGTDEGLAGAVWSAWENATTTPAFSLTGLAWNTTYYYQCYSQRTDDGDYNTTSSISNFTTLERLPTVITVDDDKIQFPNANFTTITDALAASMDGDTILVYPGTYSGYHEVTAQVNLTGIGWPEVSGNETDPYPLNGDVFVFRTEGCILDGFVIRDAWCSRSSTEESAAVRITSLGSNTIIRNNRIDDSLYGIIANPSSNNNIIHNNIINGTYYGVWLKYARNTLFANNTVTNNYYWVLHNTYSTSTTSNYATNNRIENNTFDPAGWTPFGYDESTGREVLIDDTGGNVFSHNTLLNQTYIEINGDGNTIEDNQVLGPFEYHFAGIHISEDGNIVRNNTVENQKFGILLTEQADNLNMSGNAISGCTYGFGFDGDIKFVSSRPARNVVDTTNTVGGNPIYWIVGETGQVYNSSTISEPGYLALIDCSDILVENFQFDNETEKNAQSFFIYRSENITLDGVTANGNAFQGVLIGNSDQITITDSNANNNGEGQSARQAGIFASNVTSSRIINTEVRSNNPVGITFQSGLGLGTNCANNLVSGCTITNNGHPTEADQSYGIRDSDSTNLTVTGCTIGNTFASRQGYGFGGDAVDSLFYNNRFVNNTVTNALSAGTGNRWNVTKTSGTNIIGGPWIAGNSWSDYAGTDTDSDGLGDTLTPYDSSGNIDHGGDYHPLLDTFVPDDIPPVVIIHTPAAGVSYPNASVPLEVSSPDGDVATWWYSLDSAVNVTFTPNTTLPSMSVGEHTIRVWANDTSGNENSSSVTFTAEEDNTPPALFVTSPEENATYTAYDVPLEVWSPDGDVFSWWYALDGAANVPFTPNTTLSVSANGNHSVVVFVDDFIGNTNMTTVNFIVNATGPAPPPQPPADTGDDTTEPLDYPLPKVEEPAFLISILTPDAGQTVERQAEVTYSANYPLARAYNQLDDGAYEQVRPGRAIPIERLTLGTHEITVTGVDYFGRYGKGSVSFEVIPLAIGEGEPLGTTAYPDDAAVSFTGRAVNYTLSFEVETASDEAVSVYLNRQLAGVPGSDPAIVPSGSSGSGVLLENVSSPSAGVYTMVTVPVPADGIVPDSENIISFVHTENPARTEDLASWHVRNVALVPDLTASAPSIRVYTPDQALGPGDEMMVWVDISGIAPEDRYTARIYLVAPDGEIISFPDGSGDAVLLDDAYVRANHYGRLPDSLSFAATDLAGTYRLVATLEPEGSDQLVSLSSVPVFFSADPAVRLYINRDILADGMPLQVMHAATGGTRAEEETLIILMEHPDGSTTYLPAGTEYYASRHYAPLGSPFETILDETVDAGWDEGTYLIRSMIYNSTDALVAQDIVTFTVSRDEGTLTLSFPLSVTGGMPASSRIWLMDAVSLAIVAEQETGTAHDDVTFSIPAGTYWYGGQLTTGTGEIMTIPVDPANRVSIQPGEAVQQRMVVQTTATLIPTEVIV